MRHLFCLTIVLTLTIQTFSVQSKEERPNVILIYSDDQGH